MPTRAPSPCKHPGCASLVHGPRCSDHEEAHRTRRDQRDRRLRGSSTERGYDRKWRRVRRWYAIRHPLCEECEDEGKTVPMDDVDHIVPFTDKSDPKRLDTNNLRSLCRNHHARKTARQTTTRSI